METHLPTAPEYWKIFYSIQAKLLTDYPARYPVPESTYDTSPLNDKAHKLALAAYNSKKSYRVSMHNMKLLVVEAVSYDKAVEQAVYLYGLEVSVDEI